MVKKVKNSFSTVVHQDNKSLFIRSAGRVYRPIFPEQYGEAFKSETKLSPGIKVHVSAQEHGPILTVLTSENYSEHWFSHGNFDQFNTETAWKPTVYLNWN